MICYCHAPDLLLAIICIHVPPAWTNGAKRNLFSSIRLAIPGGFKLLWIAAGDFNFGHDPCDISLDASHWSRTTRIPDATQEAWHHSFPECLELFQAQWTHRSAEGFTRLDRIYTGLPTTLLLDLKPVMDLD